MKRRFVYGEVEVWLFGYGDLVFLGLGFSLGISSFRLFLYGVFLRAFWAKRNAHLSL